MKRVLLAVATLTLASTLGAQGTGSMMSSGGSGFSISLGGGATFPTGSGSNNVNTGWNAMGAVGFMAPMIPFGLRVDGIYNNFSAKSGGSSAHTTVGSLNGMFAVPMEASSISPYITGGIGVGNVGFGSCTTCTTQSSQTAFSYNVGGGVKFGLTGFDVFAEGRYMSILTDGGSTNMVPVTVGITFHP